MQYKSFRIRNFKGIKDTTVSFESLTGANVFAFVGLNESGKTTILEAIHSFAPDEATSQLLSGEIDIGVPFRERVPRHLLSDFTGYVSVMATLQITLDDWHNIQRKLLLDHAIELNSENLPSEFTLERQQKFENGDFKATFFSIRTPLEVKSKSQRKWRKLEQNEEIIKVREAIFHFAPKIAYFPTFVFNFPKSIFLTERGNVVDKFYRRVFQGILDFDGRGQTIEQDIIRRVRRPDMSIPWIPFLTKWTANDDKDKIQQVMDRASQAVSRLVFGRWNQIFGENTRAC